MKMMFRFAARFSGSLSWSSRSPWALENVFQSRCAATMSSKRERAQKPSSSLR
jgi:hypothetical protein